MKKLLIILIAAIATTLTFDSCKKGDEAAAKFKADSIAMRQEQMLEIGDMMGEISAIIDSINAEENEITVLTAEGSKHSKEQVIAKLKHVQQLMDAKKQRIAELEAQLEKRIGENKTLSRDYENMKTIVAQLRKDVEGKERQIASLQAELASANDYAAVLVRENTQLTQSNTSLRSSVESQERTIAKQEQVIASQEQGLRQQDEALNTVYYCIDTKANLVAAGIATKTGLFKSKTKANTEGYASGAFKSGNKLTLKNFNIPASKCKILSGQPESSYTITKSGKSCTLTIIDPAAFWRASQYLVVQF
ncbi:MAG: hypothetical protein Q4D23_07850 [Bacteroidales bacterium]|nr:hypothetical protein [Bacteroidales bacterium]